MWNHMQCIHNSHRNWDEFKGMKRRMALWHIGPYWPKMFINSVGLFIFLLAWLCNAAKIGETDSALGLVFFWIIRGWLLRDSYETFLIWRFWLNFSISRLGDFSFFMRDKNKFEQTKSFYNVWQRPTIFMANWRFKSITSESLQSIKTAQLDQMIIEWGREGLGRVTVVWKSSNWQKRKTLKDDFLCFVYHVWLSCEQKSTWDLILTHSHGWVRPSRSFWQIELDLGSLFFNYLGR